MTPKKNRRSDERRRERATLKASPLRKQLPYITASDFSGKMAIAIQNSKRLAIFVAPIQVLHAAGSICAVFFLLIEAAGDSIKVGT
jgi:hypothetical protein